MTSSWGRCSGVDMTWQPFLTAKSKVLGSRAATHSLGWGFCNGFGTDVTAGNCQSSPSWA